MPVYARSTPPSESEQVQALKDVIKFQNDEILRLMHEKDQLCERLMITNEAIARAMRNVAQKGGEK